ncbi:MAG: Ig-like domain repeat protein, partial [Dermatophilaceae bacterium]
ASKALTGVAAGSYSYKAVFTPTDAALFTPSTSLVVAYVVTAAPPVVVTTTTALAVTPVSPVVAPASPTLTATVTGAGAAGTVEFFNGTTSLGTSPVAAGIASKALTGVAAGSYSYKAVFTPTDAALFTPSTSLVVAFVVTVPSTTGAVISSLSPDHGVIGTLVTIRGTGFGAPGTVLFGDHTGIPTSWTDTQITVRVPWSFGYSVQYSEIYQVPVWYRWVKQVQVTVTPKDGVASNGMPFVWSTKDNTGEDSHGLSPTSLIGTNHLGMYADYGDTKCTVCHSGATATSQSRPPILAVKNLNMRPGQACATCHAPGAKKFPIFTYQMNDPTKIVYNRCSDCHKMNLQSAG